MSRRLAGVAALVLLVSGSGSLAIHSGHVQGHVYDENGKPIGGALVTISGPEAVGIWKCPTDAEGFYRIAGLAASKILTVRVEAPERALFERTGYSVRDDQTLHLNIRLRPKGVFQTLVIVDTRVPYHRTALAGSRRTLPPGVKVFEVTTQTPSTIRRLHRAMNSRPDGVLAIGSLSARLAREAIYDTPVVYTLVLDPVKENLTARNLCGSPANGAFSEQIDLLERMAPRVRRLGLLFDPDRLDGVVRQFRSEAEDAGFTVASHAVHDPNEVEAGLGALAGARIEAFMLLLDPGLYTNAVFNRVRAFAQEREVVLIVPDASMVRAGATFSYAPGFEEMGAYAGRLLTQIVKREVSVTDIGVIFPRTRFFALNPQDAERFGLQPPKDLLPGPVPGDAPVLQLSPPS